MCLCVHPLNKDVSQAIIDTLLSMTANVSFYFIAILALRVKGLSLQERNALGNVPTVDHHVKEIYKYIYIYSQGQLEMLYNAISDKNKA